MTLGKNLQRLRLKSGYTQSTLSAETERISPPGVPAGWIGMVEADKIENPSKERLKIIAEVLKCSVDDFADEKGDSRLSVVDRMEIRYSLPPGVRLSDSARLKAEKIMKTVIDELSKENPEQTDEQANRPGGSDPR
jgi:transcriptional regulator with XRE-family HTH domain